MALNLKQKLSNNQNIYGTCILSTSPIWSKVVKGMGLDFVFLDTEHVPLDRTELTLLCQVYSAHGMSPVVRIPSPDPYSACMAKDAGAVGVLAPYIENIDQVQQMVGATKYRPLKGERLQNVLSGKEELSAALKSYLHNFNQDSLCFINIESTIAVQRLDELIKVPGLDGIIIGPHDLSINMGLPEQYDHPDFVGTVKNIIRKARAKGLAAGIHFPAHPEYQIKYVKEGANIVLHSSDMRLFSQKLSEDLSSIKQALGDNHNLSAGGELAI
ncbi:aldolase/citrate lyase family protein [Arenibacter sp. M-2]|uniref:HpcH/HpaI aldolase family protein n=1 Tax=Arenibacter sp. M-2 TaxID=3053612 RepID=UPI00257122F5|nr:aldolase/citrate lyase family protein [Arenibacter sp. M-2]MDL5512860.1 aldolase/citrate lyase family protein [Arenibacter sp. M-2]|tara:strand:- start:17148 stop:17960 length:813 start_codon:yes stop_codon:yes gene_type:complete